MKIIEPKVELWLQEDAKAHVARCARVCYGRETGNDEATIKRLINDKHWSMFRHESVYAIIPHKDVKHLWYDVTVNYTECPYIDWICFGDNYYVSTNGNFLLDVEKKNPVLYKWLTKYRVDAIEFNNISLEVSNLMRYTFVIDTQRITSSDTNRVSPNNIAERSTRYINFDKHDGGIKICKFEHFDELPKELQDRFIKKWNEEEQLYKDVLNAGFKIDIARHALSFPLATKIVYTYSVKEWRHFIDNRYHGVTGKPHDDYKLIAGMIRNELMELGYEFR